jgi:hypothetical protein
MKVDLSKYHYPLHQSSNLPVFPFSNEEIHFYNTNGFVKGNCVLSYEELSALREETDRIYNLEEFETELFYFYKKLSTQDRITFQASGAWRVSINIHDLLWNKNIGVLVNQILGANLRLWNDQIFYKPPKIGGTVAWHQDYSYWAKRSEPFAHITCWIALDDVTQENGCVEYIPGSHLWNLLPGVKLGQNPNEIKNYLTDDQISQFQNKYPMHLRAGECSFHHPKVVHGSGINDSNMFRRGIVVNIFKDGVVSKMTLSDKEEKGFPYLPSGAKLDGQYFPLIYNV